MKTSTIGKTTAISQNADTKCDHAMNGKRKKWNNRMKNNNKSNEWQTTLNKSVSFFSFCVSSTTIRLLLFARKCAYCQQIERGFFMFERLKKSKKRAKKEERKKWVSSAWRLNGRSEFNWLWYELNACHDTAEKGFLFRLFFLFRCADWQSMNGKLFIVWRLSFLKFNTKIGKTSMRLNGRNRFNYMIDVN